MSLIKRITNIIKSEISGLRSPRKNTSTSFDWEHTKDHQASDSNFQNEAQRSSIYSEQELEYYANLEVTPGSDFATIKTSYRRLLSQYHPDKFHNDERRQYAEDLTRQLNEAYRYFEQNQKRKS